MIIIDVLMMPLCRYDTRRKGLLKNWIICNLKLNLAYVNYINRIIGLLVILFDHDHMETMGKNNV